MLRFHCISNYWVVYGLRKVFFSKEILILSSKNPIILTSINCFFIFLISWICLTYKRVILYIKRKQNVFFFWNFWNIGLVLMTLINWLLKLKCMLKQSFLKFSVYEITIWFCYRDLVTCMKKIIFFYNFCNVLMKIGYFNNRFIFL